MDKTELRLEIVRVVATSNGHLKSEDVIQACKNYEAYITSCNEDKVQAPSDVEKEQQEGSTEKTKKKPRN